VSEKCLVSRGLDNWLIEKKEGLPALMHIEYR
jgi:hypothetical protein